MITMACEEPSKTDDSQVTYTPAEAVEYLRVHRGITVTVGALRQWRKRGFAQTKRVYSQGSIWTKSELDAVTPPPRSRARRDEKP